MASNTEWGPFLTYWGHYYKNVFDQTISTIRFQFSEGLLRSLYYETDVGSIPRRNFHKTASTPQYADSKNWKYPIHGCYWCVEKVKTAEFLGICCSRECLVYFHDWCIERVEFFTNKRFCRLLGCDKILHNRDNLYCSVSDQAKFDAVRQFPDHQKLLKYIVRSGPSWYVKAISIDIKYNRAKYNLEFPEHFRTELIYNTDVGVIPRGMIIHEYLTSKYYNSSNWSAEIKGCYNCDNRNVAHFYNEMFCKERCQLVFYEWCRKKIERETTTRFCQLPGCPKLASEGFECCNREHSNHIEQKYTEAKIIDIKRMISICPTWYNRSITPFKSIQSMNQQPVTIKTQKTQSHPPIQQSTKTNPQFHSSSSCFIFSRQLTEFLYFQTDVGPIPREIQPFMTSPPPPSVNQNWTVPITQCYWCCTKPRTVHNIACSDKCFFFFNEWLHNKFTNRLNQRLCRVLSCERHASGSFKCCNRDHSIQFESSFKQYFSLLKDTDFVLGPSWYADYSRNRIEFYNLEAPFYEFTNFYPCRNLIIDNINWKTSEHYFQASKFAGTPYFNCVNTLPSPRDAFKFSRERDIQKWIHPNWHSIKLTVMRHVLMEKFSQDETLLKILLRTGNAQLVEHTKNDRFWGDGGDGSGENQLGRLLVHVRDQLREFFPEITPQYNPQQTSVHTPYFDQSGKSNNSMSSSPFSSYNDPLNPEFMSMQFNAPSYQEPDSNLTKTNAISESHQQTPNADTSELKNELPDMFMSGNEPTRFGYNESTNLKGKYSLNLAQTNTEKDNIPESEDQTIQTAGTDPIHTPIIVRGEAKHQLSDDYICPYNTT